MKCARCEKEFIPKHINFFRWLLLSGLDESQQAFVFAYYGQHLCNQCLFELKECFYSVSVNPKFSNKPEI